MHPEQIPTVLVPVTSPCSSDPYLIRRPTKIPASRIEFLLFNCYERPEWPTNDPAAILAFQMQCLLFKYHERSNGPRRTVQMGYMAKGILNRMAQGWSTQVISIISGFGPVGCPKRTLSLQVGARRNSGCAPRTNLHRPRPRHALIVPPPHKHPEPGGGGVRGGRGGGRGGGCGGEREGSCWWGVGTGLFSGGI